MSMIDGAAATSGRSARPDAAAAALVLVIGMGFGRFAFTGLYPGMVAEGHLSLDGGSYAASANYAGYLIGALALGFVRGLSSRTLSLLASAVTVVTLAALALPLAEAAIVAVRGLAGMASAVAMVASSQWLIQDRGHAEGAPLLFAGVGFGILLSAETIAAGHRLGLSSAPLWLVLAVASLILALAAWHMMHGSPGPNLAVSHAAQTSAGRGGGPLPAARLIGIYGLAGFGYIITATYLPLSVKDSIGSVDPIHVWAVFGVGAIPSCFLWHALHRRWGMHRSLAANLLVQAGGVVLPALSHTSSAYLASALLVGGTFMGTVTIAMPAARRVAGTVRFNLLAIMTAAYGVGQIAGPLAASAIHARSGSFDASLLAAGGALVLAAAGCVGGGRRTREASGVRA